MRAKRLTRDESRAQTRARLLDAAAGVFLKRGFEGASLEDIAEEAGYTRGALYSNFRDKEELFLVVVERHFTQEVEEVERIFAALDTPEERVLAMQEWHAGHCDPDVDAWTPLILEFWLYAARNPDVRPRIAEMERRVRESVTRLVEQQLHDLGVVSPIPAGDLAMIIVALDSGLAGQRFVDPSAVGPNLFGQALMFLTLGVKMGGEQAPEPRRRPHAPARRRSR